MKVVAFRGSPRSNGNSSIILEKFLEGAEASGASVDIIDTEDSGIESCKGCLRCNLIKRCSLRDEEWKRVSGLIEDSDILVFASPVYFHHFTSSLKRVLDRFRSFFHIKITESGLVHTPWKKWKKELVLIASMGSPDEKEASPLVDLMNYMIEILGEGNHLHTLLGTRLAVSKQILMGRDELRSLYGKLGLSEDIAETDYLRNVELIRKSFDLGKKLGDGSGKN